MITHREMRARIKPEGKATPTLGGAQSHASPTEVVKPAARGRAEASEVGDYSSMAQSGVAEAIEGPAASTSEVTDAASTDSRQRALGVTDSVGSRVSEVA